jgi:TrwC relaxase
VALPVKALKAGQESYWLDQIARNREEYFSGRGESPGRFVGSAATAAGLEGTASAEQVRAMFQGLDPATGEQRCSPLLRADPRSKLAAGPLLAALRTRAAEQGVTELEALAGSKALQGDVRSVQAACQLGGAKRVKVETVERLCRKVLDTDPRSLYGEGFDQAWQHRGKRVNERVQPSTTASPRPRACRCWPPRPAHRPAGCWPKDGPRPSRSRSATWSAMVSGCSGSTTAPTATRRSEGWWRWPSSTA